MGFAVGVAERDRLITGEHVQRGDVLIGLPSPGLRSNGYSLARKVLLESGLEAQLDEEIARAVERFEAVGPPDPLRMFDHAYGSPPRHLAEQRREVAQRAQPAAAPDPDQPPAPMRGQRLTRR